ncbi:MAG: single-stranded DNA-binding protein [Candidatus Nitrospinota bacterium M3_3B_026]
MYNRVIIAGNLTRDPEFWESSSGIPVTRLPVAVDSGFKTTDGEKTSETLFINAVVFGAQAQPCREYLAKGAPVLVEGRLREREWEFEGKTGKKIEIVANRVKFLPRGAGAQTPQPEPDDDENIPSDSEPEPEAAEAPVEDGQ